MIVSEGAHARQTRRACCARCGLERSPNRLNASGVCDTCELARADRYWLNQRRLILRKAKR
jgi:hypothetical protein